jgi:hypothetical protein
VGPAPAKSRGPQLLGRRGGWGCGLAPGNTGGRPWGPAPRKRGGPVVAHPPESGRLWLCTRKARWAVVGPASRETRWAVAAQAPGKLAVVPPHSNCSVGGCGCSPAGAVVRMRAVAPAGGVVEGRGLWSRCMWWGWGKREWDGPWGVRLVYWLGAAAIFVLASWWRCAGRMRGQRRGGRSSGEWGLRSAVGEAVACAGGFVVACCGARGGGGGLPVVRWGSRLR